MEFEYTCHQTPRSSRPDAVSGSKAFLFKNVTQLRLTYQIRLLTFAAKERGGRLVIRVPSRTHLSPDLLEFVDSHAPALKVQRVD